MRPRLQAQSRKDCFIVILTLNWLCGFVYACVSWNHYVQFRQARGWMYRAFNHVYDWPFMHMRVCLTLSSCFLCSQFILMWIECVNNSSTIRHHFISSCISHTDLQWPALSAYGNKQIYCKLLNLCLEELHRGLRTVSKFNFDSWLACEPFRLDYVYIPT